MEIERILIVCTGNLCRSPMAAALMRRMLEEEQGADVQVESAGIAALAGHPADAHARTLLADEGLDISAHRARQLSERMLLQADLVLVMDRLQRRAVYAVAPLARGKVMLLGEWTGQEIPDPYGGDLRAFRTSLALIRDAVSSWRGKIR
jgi:protein-tyrosine phosphatase